MDKEIEKFKALSDKNRLVILKMLKNGELCACEIIKKLDLKQPTISHHMKVLQDAGLVNGRKAGKWIHYSINQDAIGQSVEFIKSITH